LSAAAEAATSIHFVGMSLFSQRQATLQEAAARARGEEVDGLVDEVPKEFRQQLVYAVREAATWLVGPDWQVRNLNRYLINRITDHLREEYGWPCLAIQTDQDGADLASFILDRATRGGRYGPAVTGAVQPMLVVAGLPLRLRPGLSRRRSSACAAARPGAPAGHRPR
jgi:hypothetical protein